MSVTIQWLKKWKPKNLISPCKTFVFSPPPFGLPYRIFKILDFPRAKTFPKLSNRNRWNSPCLHQQWDESNPANIYLVKVNNKNTGNMYICKICSKLTIQTSERGRWRCSGVFIVNFEYISQLFLVFLLLTFDR